MHAISMYLYGHFHNLYESGLSDVTKTLLGEGAGKKFLHPYQEH